MQKTAGKVIILGCGGSNGVPEIGCKCQVCTSDNSKNYRTRASIYIDTPKAKILVDTTPDLRQQALSNNITELDAVLFTHLHSDHVNGIDDIKAFTKDKIIPAYGDELTMNNLCNNFIYLFEQKSHLYKPRLHSYIVKHNSSIEINGTEIRFFPQRHGKLTVLGIRVGNIAYSTDFDSLPTAAFAALEGIDTWIVDCLRYHWAPSHNFYEKVLGLVARVKPKRTILTHMAHQICYDEISKFLPEGIEPGYDGMVIEL
jgi:phosphoribosyl 1,2-cyclic phosphate phosphodiesterase